MIFFSFFRLTIGTNTNLKLELTALKNQKQNQIPKRTVKNPQRKVNGIGLIKVHMKDDVIFLGNCTKITILADF